MFKRFKARKINKMLKENSLIRTDMLRQLKEYGYDLDKLKNTPELQEISEATVKKIKKKGFTMDIQGKELMFYYPKGVTKKMYAFASNILGFMIIDKNNAPIVSIKLKCLNNKTKQKETLIVKSCFENQAISYLSNEFKSGFKFEFNGNVYTLLSKKAPRLEFKSFKSNKEYLDFGVVITEDLNYALIKNYIEGTYSSMIEQRLRDDLVFQYKESL